MRLLLLVFIHRQALRSAPPILLRQPDTQVNRHKCPILIDKMFLLLLDESWRHVIPPTLPFPFFSLSLSSPMLLLFPLLPSSIPALPSSPSNTTTQTFSTPFPPPTHTHIHILIYTSYRPPHFPPHLTSTPRLPTYPCNTFPSSHLIFPPSSSCSCSLQLSLKNFSSSSSSFSIHFSEKFHCDVLSEHL